MFNPPVRLLQIPLAAILALCLSAKGMCAEVTSLANSGPGTLRTAIASAAAGETITFNPTLNGQTIYLTASATGLTLSRNVIVDASSLPSGITISMAPSPAARVFEVLPSVVATLDSLTLTRGTSGSGAGIYNRGNLTIRDSTLFDHQGLGILNYGMLTLVDSTISLCSGGGIDNRGMMLVEGSTFSRNSGTAGGGVVANYGPAELRNSTLANNNSTSLPLFNVSSLTMVSSTVAGNSLSEPAIRNQGTLTLENSIAERNANASPGRYGIEGIYTAIGTNIVPADSRGHLGTGIVVKKPAMLRPLFNYGGATETMPPLPGSPAIDAAGASSMAEDQRGFTRNSGPLPDIGAVELQEILVNTTEDEVDGIGVNGISLREAIAGPGEVIRFDPAVFPATITLNGTQLDILRQVSIDASNIDGGVRIDADGLSGVMKIGSGRTAALRGLTITGGGGPSGSGVTFQGDSTGFIDQCSIHGNEGGDGGGIRNFGALTITNSTISGNTASRNWGGGIYHYKGAPVFGFLRIRHSTITGNSADLAGGGIYTSNDTVEIEDSICADNTASSERNDFDGGSFDFSGNNIVTDLGGSGYISPPNGVTVTDPLLAPLGDYGGLTSTRPPLPGSPAIEGAKSSTAMVDQIGHSRPSGAFSDIGAVEALPFSTFALVSADGDSIPDILEGPGTSYPHLDPSVDDSTVDTDDDGSSDAEEIGNMTNLYDAGDRFRILSMQQADGFDPLANPIFELTIQTFPGLVYQIEHQSDLSLPFGPLGAPVTAEDFVTTLRVTLDTERDFVRVRR